MSRRLIGVFAVRVEPPVSATPLRPSRLLCWLSVVSDASAELRPESRTQSGLPPHDVGAEEAIVAALLLDGGVLDELRLLVRPEDFFREQNAWCYEAALAIAKRGDAITIPTLAHELDRADRLDAAGGEPFLADLTARHFTAIGVEAHAKIVARDAVYRRMIDAAGKIAQAAYRGGPEMDEVTADAMRTLEAASEHSSGSGVIDMVTALDRMHAGENAHAVSTGYPSLDAILGGLRMGQLTIVGARTDHGKTGLVSGMALRQATAGVPLLYVPLEDSRDEVLAKMADAVTGRSVDYAEKVGWGSQSMEQWSQNLDDLFMLPIFWPDDGKTPRGIDELQSRIAIAHRKHKVQVVYIDHIDALPVTRHRGGQGDASAMADTMRGLKALALRLDVHIVIASQVNREADKHGGVPFMWELKESGSKEQQVQNVLMLDLSPNVFQGRQELDVFVAKVKGFPRGRRVVHKEHPALYLEVTSGAVRDQQWSGYGLTAD